MSAPTVDIGIRDPLGESGRRRGNLVVLCGIADGLAPVGYLLIGTPVALQLLGLLAKVALLVVAGRRLGARLTAAQWAAVLTIIVLAAVSFLVDAGTADLAAADYIGYLTVAASLWLTVRLVALADLDGFALGFALPAVGVGVVHVLQAQTGQLASVGGRFGYVRDLHPNLGGEIAAAAVAAAAIGLRLRAFLFCSAVLGYSSYLTQARSAQVAIAFTVGVRVLFELKARARRRSGVWVPWVLGALAVGVVIVWGQALVQFALDDVLLTDNAYRGTGTGVAGRELGWSLAVDTFLANPITGGGIGYVNALGEDAVPHNAFLAGLARHGVLSLLFWIPLAIGLARLWRLRRPVVIALAGQALLIMLNARFINLNPYPYFLYACALIALGRTGSTDRTAPVRAPR